MASYKLTKANTLTKTQFLKRELPIELIQPVFFSIEQWYSTAQQTIIKREGIGLETYKDRND